MPQTCMTCHHAEQYGSWPKELKGTHCKECHRSWGGKRESHCPECHLHFSADSVADKHRTRGVCLDAADLHNLVSKAGKPVLRVVDTPNGEMWRFAASLPVISKPRWAAT